MQAMEMDPIYSFMLASDIQRKVISTRIASNPRFPLSAPTNSNGWVAHTNSSTSFRVQNVKQRGNYKAFRLGGVLFLLKKKEMTLEWKLRMKVDFHHKFVVNE